MTGLILGRAASEIASILRGKHKPTFCPHLDSGDNVIIINAQHIQLTGKKWTKKKYYRHSGYMGELKVRTAKEIFERKPEELLSRAVKGMLPKTKLGRKIFKNCRIYPGAEHPHQAQCPIPIGPQFKRIQGIGAFDLTERLYL